jgi:hypothetical protein
MARGCLRATCATIIKRRFAATIALPVVSCYEAGQSYIATQGRVFVVRYAYGQAANWQELEDAIRQAIGTYRYTPYGSELYPCPTELAARVGG